MTIDEAIKELEYPDWLITENHTPEYSEAVALGKEALERLREDRYYKRASYFRLLPGETEGSNPRGLPLKGIVVDIEKGGQK